MHLEPRVGARPATSSEGPHRQLDQQAPPAIWGELVAQVFTLEGVVEGISQVSPVSSRAVYLVDLDEEAGPGRSLAPGGRLEPVHLHGVQDTSAHLVLPMARGEELVRLGWAEPHQYADFGTEFLVFGPRDSDELGTVLSIIEESLAFARSAA
ncbi:luciferase family protein [Serinicoccus marinus]|uniref:luciferase domain-containing protein n=1 Tax=Serinicoccus marinus TaxID=247333 RepID=UPI0003B2EF62|nr:luciferase family protein [Serinicoccus marinus]